MAAQTAVFGNIEMPSFFQSVRRGRSSVHPASVMTPAATEYTPAPNARRGRQLGSGPAAAGVAFASFTRAPAPVPSAVR